MSHRTSMPINLKPEHERLVDKAIKSGAYDDADQVIEQALQMLFTQDEWLRNQRHDIAAKIDRGLAQFEKGEFFSSDEARAEIQKRKKAWSDER